MSDTQTIYDNLHSGIVVIKFIKVNGQHRTMRCTLNSAFLPDQADESRGARRNDGVVVVWDVEANGWRSVRVTSILDWYAEGVIEVRQATPDEINQVQELTLEDAMKDIEAGNTKELPPIGDSKISFVGKKPKKTK